MKFGKILKTTSENLLPEMSELFLRYKDLKKQLKSIPKQPQPVPIQTAAAEDAAMGEELHILPFCWE